MRGNSWSWGPPPLSHLSHKLVRSVRSRCDCDHRKCVFCALDGHRRWRVKITFSKGVRGEIAIKTAPWRRGFFRALRCGTSAGAFGPLRGLVAPGNLLARSSASHAWQALTPAAALSRERSSPLGFTVERGLVLQAIVAREPAHQRTVHPIVEHPAHIFPRNACHGGEVALGDFLPDEDAPLADVTAKRLGKIQQRARNPSLHGEKVRG